MSRLKCSDWVTPSWYSRRPRPLHIDLGLSLHQLRMEKLKGIEASQAITRLQEFVDFMAAAEANHKLSAFGTRIDCIKVAGNVCDMSTSVLKIFQKAGSRLPESTLKNLRAFDKIANYMLVTKRLAHAAASYRSSHLFELISFNFLEPYENRQMNSLSRHVHAEIQLATFHRLRRIESLPKTIGTSKGACYLCDLFLSYHRPRYRVSATHGQLFEAWTIPDVKEYSEQDRIEIEGIIRKMQKALETRSIQKIPLLRFPNQSCIYNAPSVTSLTSPTLNQIDEGQDLVLLGPSSLPAISNLVDEEFTARDQSLTQDKRYVPGGSAQLQVSQAVEGRVEAQRAHEDDCNRSGLGTGAKIQPKKSESVIQDSTEDTSIPGTEKLTSEDIAIDHTLSTAIQPLRIIDSATNGPVGVADLSNIPSTTVRASKKRRQLISDFAKKKDNKGQRRHRRSKQRNSSAPKINRRPQKPLQRKHNEKVISGRGRHHRSSRKRHHRPQRKDQPTKKSGGQPLRKILSRFLRRLKTLFCS